MIAVEDARAIILEAAHPLNPVRVPLDEAFGRVLAEDAVADSDIPPFANSAMDGYAVRAEDVATATPDAPTVLRILGDVAAGTVAERPVEPGTCYQISTGAPMPPGADTAIMRELTEPVGRDQVRIMASRPSGANVRHAGEDMKKGETVLRAGTLLRAGELGVLATVGMAEPLVYPAPRVAVLATGSELIPASEPLRPGKIRNSNGYTLAAQVRAAGAVPVSLGTVADDEAETEAKIREALTCDVVLTSGGVSVGEHDFVKATHERLGTEFKFWRINMKPGKPTAFGVNDDTLVFGIPGNPVASMVVFEEFVRPALLKMMGQTKLTRPAVSAVADDTFAADDGKTHFVRVVVRKDNGTYRAASAGGQGSHQISGFARANGLLILTPERQEVSAGETAEVHLFDVPEWAP